MPEDFLEIDLQIGAGRDVPFWLWELNPFRIRIFRSALEEARGSISPQMTLERAYADVRTTIDAAAERKIVQARGQLAQPIPIIRADIIGP